MKVSSVAQRARLQTLGLVDDKRFTHFEVVAPRIACDVHSTAPLPCSARNAILLIRSL